MKTTNKLLLILAGAFLCFPSLAQDKPAVSFIAAGSGVNLGITKLLAEAYKAQHPDVKIDVPGSIGTKGAITAVKDNAITFGLISRPLKDTEQSPDFKTLAYAKTAIVVGANPTVKDDGITSDELTAIYKGSKTHWMDGQEIIVQLREAFDSGFMVLENKIKGFKEVCDESRQAKKWTTYFTDQESNHALATTPYAIGVTDMGMIATEHLAIKPLALDGITPSVEMIANGQYPLSRTLYFLYRDKTLPAQAKAFLAFVASPEATEILRANNYLPLLAK